MEKNQSKADQVPNRTTVKEKGLPTEKLHLMKAAPLPPHLKRILLLIKSYIRIKKR